MPLQAMLDLILIMPSFPSLKISNTDLVCMNQRPDLSCFELLYLYKFFLFFYFSENSEIAEERAERDLSNDDTELVSENITESLQHWVITFSIIFDILS